MENASLSHSFQDIAFKPISSECAGDIAKTHEQHAKIEGLIQRCFSSLEERNTDEARRLMLTTSQEIEQMQGDIQKIKNVMAHEHPETMHSEEHTLPLEEKLAQNVKALTDIKIRYFNETIEKIANKVRSFRPYNLESDTEQEYSQEYSLYNTRVDGGKEKNILRDLETLQDEEKRLPPGIPTTVIEEARFKLAKVYAEKIGFITTINIQDFQLRDEAHRIEIAKLCAKHTGSGVAQHLEAFQIDPSNQTAFMEIATLCAQDTASHLPENIEKFHINPSNQIARIELAKLCAQHNISQTIIHIKNFGITDQDVIIEIAKMGAQNDIWTLGDTIRDFPIPHENQTARIELAKLGAKTSVLATAKNIRNFGITDPKAMVEIAMFCAVQDPEATLHELNSFFIQDPITLWQICLACIIQNRAMLNKALEYLGENIILPYKKAFEKQLQKIEQEIISKAPEQEEQIEAWFRFAGAGVLLQPTDEPQDSFLEFIKKASSYRNPQQRFALLSAWYEGSQRGAFSERQTPLSTEPIPPSQWPCTIFLALLKSKGVTDTEAFLRALPKRWHDEAKALPIVLGTLHLLCQENDLTSMDISHILSVLVNRLAGKQGKALEKELCSQCLIIRALIDNGLAHKLKTEEMGVRDLSTLFQDSFQEIFPIGRDSNFKELYDATLGKFRQTNALFVYRGALQRLQEPDRTDCLEALNQFVGAVLHSTFKTERYDTTKSEHLQTVMRDADLLRKWQTGAQKPIQTTLGEGFAVVDSDDPCDLLLSGTEVTGSCQRISGDQNLNKCLLGYILNGENRIIAIKNAAGEIIARRIIRVLWDEEEQKPVLFIEKLYTVGTVPEDIQSSLDTFAKERAQELGLPLLTAEEGTDLYGHSVKCFAGRAPFVYSDGVGGVCPKSVFSIDSPRIFA